MKTRNKSRVFSLSRIWYISFNICVRALHQLTQVLRITAVAFLLFANFIFIRKDSQEYRLNGKIFGSAPTPG